MFCVIILVLCSLIILDNGYVSGHPRNLAWSGGPLHLECEHSAEVFTRNGQYIRENVIAIKAVTFKDEIYVITPRIKQGVPATLWLVIQGRNGVELQPYPNLCAHTLADCRKIQNAVDFYLDNIGNLWILDTGIVDTLETPKCTCPPKVVMISTFLGNIMKLINLSTLAEPTSLLQNIVVEHGIGGKPFVYISDAPHGSILVIDVFSGSEWVVQACSPTSGLQLALVKRGPAHTLLILAIMNQPGLLELDTTALRRKLSNAPLRAFGEHTKPVYLLGSDNHHVYMRTADCTDVMSWDARYIYNETYLIDIHSPGPQLSPTSVAGDTFKHILIILDSNYGHTVRGNQPTYHKITFIGQH